MNALTGFFDAMSHWLHEPAARWALTSLYVAVLLAIAVYGLHRYWLVWLYYRTRGNPQPPSARFDTLPHVTVQLPMYNESQVAQRLIDAACAMDWPVDRLHIQVLDDSTDDCSDIARQRVAYWVHRGIDIQYLHRTHRAGFKAGALAEGLLRDSSDLIAIFDADFVPPADFLHQTVHHFADPGVGMVQARWGHLNRNDSTLTRSQAIFLDGHFIIEHTSRNRAGRWINFNGTAGLWRRKAIDDAGGWQADTLTEDVDLSYRAQLAGWRFIYLPDVICPAELPPEINAFKAQQHRWTKGSIQTARKLLWKLMRSPAPTRVKIEAFFHLTSPVVYLLVTLMALLFYPAFYVNMQPFEEGTAGGLIWGVTLFALGTASAGAYYIASQRAQQRSGWTTFFQLPILMCIGIGIALNNARGVIEAAFGHQSEFVRTPKYNTDRSGAIGRKILPTPSIKLWMSLMEIGMGLYTLNCAWLAMSHERTVVSLPFLLLFAAGYLYVGVTSLQSRWNTNRRQAEPAPA